MNKASRASAMTSNRSTSDKSGSADSGDTVRPIPQAAPQRRASDTQAPPAPTIDSVRDLLLGDTIKQSRRELNSIERKTHDQMGELRVELGDRIDRVVRALSTVNQAVHKEFGAREEAVRESSETISNHVEDRVSFLEAKIYTVVADMERKVSAAHAADNDKLIEKLAEANARTEASVLALTEKFEQQLKVFGSRITAEIAQVNKEVKDKLAAVQAQTGNELEAAGSKLGEQLGAAETRFNGELGSLRSELDKSSAQMREEIQHRASEQQATIARSEANTQATLRNHLQTLEGRKVSRNDFSTLLHELAARLEDPQESAMSDRSDGLTDGTRAGE